MSTTWRHLIQSCTGKMVRNCYSIVNIDALSVCVCVGGSGGGGAVGRALVITSGILYSVMR